MLMAQEKVYIETTVQEAGNDYNPGLLWTEIHGPV
jgi:hypothetical protein